MRPPIDYAALRGSNVYLAYPLYDNKMHIGFHRSISALVQACMRHGIRYAEKCAGCDSLVPRARNTTVAYFLETPPDRYTNFLTIDSDITFDPEDVLSVLACPEPIVAGVYPRKQLDWNRIYRAARAGVPPEQLPHYGFIPVMNWKHPGDFALDSLISDIKHVGTGFLRIHREVFTTMISREVAIAYDYPHEWDFFKGKVGYDFFPIGPDVRYPLGSGGRQYLSEDWAFSEMASLCGYTLNVAPWISLTHSGSMDYSGSLDVMDSAIEDYLNEAAPSPDLSLGELPIDGQDHVSTQRE